MTATSNPPPPAISALVPIVLRMTTQHGGQWPARIANHCGFPFKAGDDFASALTAWANTDKPDLDTDARRELLREVGNAFVNKKPDNLKPMPVTPSPAPKAEATTPQAAYEALIPLIAKRGPDGHKRAAAHLREVTGRTLALPNYVNSTDYKDADKLALFRALAAAMESQDYSKLKGQPAAGDKRIDPISGPITLHHKAPVPVDVPEIAPRVTSPATDNQEDVARELANILARIKGGGTAKLDETRVREIAAEVAAEIPTGIDALKASEIALTVVKKALSNGEFPMDRVNTAIKEALAKVGATRIDIVSPDGGVRSIEGRQHYKFPLLVACLSQRLNVALVGPAGSTKTSTARAAARALNLPFAATSFGPMTSKSDLFGYKDAAGHYHETDLVRMAHSGGVYLGDEFDAGNAGVATYTNMLTACQAGEEFSTPVGMKAKHQDFCFIAGLNTYGMGANRVYVGRNQQDGATMDRLVVIDWDYDEGLEASFIGLQEKSPVLELQAGGNMTKEAWFAYVKQVRASAAKLGIRHIISPRATIHGDKLFHAGVGRAHIEQMVLWKGLEQAQVEKIKAGVV